MRKRCAKSSSCSEAAAALYKIFVTGDCVITNARTAEMAKLTENSFRDVNNNPLSWFAADDGEVEDYRVTIQPPFDFGDAIEKFVTRDEGWAASHHLDNWATAPRLGATVDGELQGKAVGWARTGLFGAALGLSFSSPQSGHRWT